MCPGNYNRITLKLLATTKEGKAKFSSPTKMEDEDRRIALELDLAAAVQLYKALYRRDNSFSYRIARPNIPAKELTCVSSSGQFVYRFDFRSDGRQVSVGIDAADQFHIHAVILAMLKLLYPWLSDGTLHNLLVEGDARSSNHIAIHDAQILAFPTPQADIFGANESPLTPDQSKALWAIANRKWPARRLEVVKAMQRFMGTNAADSAIKAANAGDFAVFEEAARLFDEDRLPT